MRVEHGEKSARLCFKNKVEHFIGEVVDMIPRNYKDRRGEGDTVLRQCQLVQLHLLYVFDRICKENGLCYLLEAGTLLGAMRHNGFIPWDDDLDVGMPRKEYEKFLKLAPALLPDDVYLHTPSDTPRTAIPFAKLRDAYSFYGDHRRDIAIADPNGIYIDIFPYDDMPAVGRPLQRFLSLACSSTWMRTKYYHRCGRFIMLDIVHALVGLFFSCLHDLCRLLIWFLNRVLPSKDYYLCLESQFVVRYAKEDMFPAKEHVFEDGSFPIPANADKVLSEWYGDWRWIPPVDKRPRHATVIDPFHSASDRHEEYPSVEN